MQPPLFVTKRLEATLAAATVVMALAASPAAARQSSSSLAALAALVQPGSELRVVDVQSSVVTGRFVRLSATGIVLKLASGEREIAAADIAFIDRKGDPLWNGALLGGVILGVSGAAGAGSSCSPECGSTVTGAALGMGAIGAGVGLLIDKAWAGRQRIYTAPNPSGAVSPPTAPPPTPAAGSAAAAARSFDAISSAVKPNDTIAVTLSDGVVRTGRFVSASADGLTFLEDKRTSSVTRSAIRSIERRTRRAQQGMAIGLFTGIALGAVAAGSSGENAGAGVAGGAVGGLIWGGIIGALMSTKETVYDARSPQSSVAITTEVAWQRIGLGAIIRF